MKKILSVMLLAVFLLIPVACAKGTTTISTLPLPDTTAQSPTKTQTSATTTSPQTEATIALTTTNPSKIPLTITSAVNQLKKGWKQQPVFDHSLINPSVVFADNTGNIMVVSQGNNRILSLSGNGDLTEFADTSRLPGISTVGYQPGRSRLLVIDHTGGLYQYADGQWKELKSFSLFITTMAIDSRDDSFYGAAQTSNGKIIHYDADGNQLSVIVQGINGCFQVLLDEKTNTLYYTETFAGKITAVDLRDNSQRVIATGVGIPGTFEPIALGFDEDNQLYYFTANQGLNRYENNGFLKVMDSISGVGMMVWSAEARAFLVGNAAGSNIIAYDPVTAEARHLTPYINAWGIVSLNDGTVLISENTIFRVDENGLSSIVKDMPAPCYHLERDDDGLIYAGLIDGSIWLCSADGTMQEWCAGFTDWPVVSLSYDSKNRAMVSVNANHSLSRAAVWRIPLDTPFSPVKVLEMPNVRVTPHLPLATVDDTGNIYIIERQANAIYRIADGTSVKTLFISSVLENEAITVPCIEYSRIENALVISTIQNYELWPLDNLVRQTLAINAGSVDNFCINEGSDGDLVMMQSGRVFRLVPSL